jgi:adenylate cyclase
VPGTSEGRWPRAYIGGRSGPALQRVRDNVVGMPLLPVNWMYRRLGRAYPAAFLVILLSIGTLVTAGTLALVSLFYDRQFDDRELIVLLIITEALTVLGLSFGFLRAIPRMRPLKAWITGARDERSSLAAWDSAVNLPIRVFKEDVTTALAVAGLPSVVLVIVVADLEWTSFFPLLVVGAVATTYAAVLQYFAIEIGMRPVVSDLVRCLPDEFSFERTGLSMRAKLLTLIPLTSVLTGMVVAAITGRDSLGVALLVVLGVAFSIALELTLLLSDSLLRPITALLRGQRAIESGDYDVRVPVTTSDDLGELCDGFNRMAAGLAERERIREAFGTYLDREVAEYILTQGVNPAGVEVDVSILFCDVRNFTQFASDAEATEVVSALNRLFEVIVPIVAEHGGHIDKFMGDGLLAVFGAPEPYEDHADRALAAGCEIVAAVESVAAGELRVGVGINSGRVVAGSIGGAGRLNFSVIGDAVNVAARVEAETHATGDTLLLTGATRVALRRTEVELTSRGHVRLKGKAEPIELFAVAAPVEAPARPVQEPATRGATQEPATRGAT